MTNSGKLWETSTNCSGKLWQVLLNPSKIGIPRANVLKMCWETRKIFGDESINVSATCVRIPVFFGHSEAVQVETSDHISENEVRDLLGQAEGVTVIDERCDGGYPTAVHESAGNDSVFVGRIRQDISLKNLFKLLVVSDNVRKVAALN